MHRQLVECAPEARQINAEFPTLNMGHHTTGSGSNLEEREALVGVCVDEVERAHVEPPATPDGKGYELNRQQHPDLAQDHAVADERQHLATGRGA
eukprot:3124960-Rhodomonas_salina.1